MTLIAYAASGRTLEYYVNNVIIAIIVDFLVPIVIGFMVIYFLWGLFNFMKDGGDVKKRAEGMRYMLNAGIGLLIAVTVWGIVDIFANIFGASAVIPQIGG